MQVPNIFSYTLIKKLLICNYTQPFIYLYGIPTAFLQHILNNISQKILPGMHAHYHNESNI